MATAISPNRSELMRLKTKIGMAKRGHSLLKKKRDGLIMSFFELLHGAKDLRAELSSSLKAAQKSLRDTRILSYDLELKMIAHTTTGRNLIDFQSKNIMGLSIPEIQSTFEKRSLIERNKTIYGTAALDGTMQQYEDVVKKIVIIAEIETAMLRLLKEIEKTKRRVNGLEHKILPDLEAAKAFVQLSLEEQERDNLIMLKRVKDKE